MLLEKIKSAFSFYEEVTERKNPNLDNVVLTWFEKMWLKKTPIIKMTFKEKTNNDVQEVIVEDFHEPIRSLKR